MEEMLTVRSVVPVSSVTVNDPPLDKVTASEKLTVMLIASPTLKVPLDVVEVILAIVGLGSANLIPHNSCPLVFSEAEK